MTSSKDMPTEGTEPSGAPADELDLVAKAPGVEPGAVTAPRGELPPVERISDKEIRERIDAAIEKLSPEHRAAIVMREIEGLEYSEIAERMECSIGTVMSRLFYARKKLQAMLK